MEINEQISFKKFITMEICDEMYHALEHLLMPVKVTRDACEQFIGKINDGDHARLYMFSSDYHMFAMYVVNNENSTIKYYLIKVD